MYSCSLWLKFVLSQAKSQQKATERASVQTALRGVTAGKIEKEFEMYKQEMDAKLDKANLL